MDFKKRTELLSEQQILPPIDLSLNDLSVEMKSLFVILDELSINIKKVEANLAQQKAHFPFRCLIDVKDGGSKHSVDLEKSIELINLPCAGYYYIRTRTYLAWEEDITSRNYRLLLICEEIVTDSIFFNYKIYATKYLSSKPFIETNLKIRLEYAKYLINFLDAFKSYLKEFRLSIEQLDILPF